VKSFGHSSLLDSIDLEDSEDATLAICHRLIKVRSRVPKKASFLLDIKRHMGVRSNAMVIATVGCLEADENRCYAMSHRILSRSLSKIIFQTTEMNRRRMLSNSLDRSATNETYEISRRSLVDHFNLIRYRFDR